MHFLIGLFILFLLATPALAQPASQTAGSVAGVTVDVHWQNAASPDYVHRGEAAEFIFQPKPDDAQPPITVPDARPDFPPRERQKLSLTIDGRDLTSVFSVSRDFGVGIGSAGLVKLDGGTAFGVSLHKKF